jgi:hypothetical protein
MFVKPPGVQAGGGPTEIEMARAILAVGVPVVARLGRKRAIAEERGPGLALDDAAGRVDAVAALEVADVLLRLFVKVAGHPLRVPAVLQS